MERVFTFKCPMCLKDRFVWNKSNCWFKNTDKRICKYCHEKVKQKFEIAI